MTEKIDIPLEDYLHFVTLHSSYSYLWMDKWHNYSCAACINLLPPDKITPVGNIFNLASEQYLENSSASRFPPNCIVLERCEVVMAPVKTALTTKVDTGSPYQLDLNQV